MHAGRIPKMSSDKNKLMIKEIISNSYNIWLPKEYLEY
jgi:hypothetical protein